MSAAGVGIDDAGVAEACEPAVPRIATGEGIVAVKGKRDVECLRGSVLEQSVKVWVQVVGDDDGAVGRDGFAGG